MGVAVGGRVAIRGASEVGARPIGAVRPGASKNILATVGPPTLAGPAAGASRRVPRRSASDLDRQSDGEP